MLKKDLILKNPLRALEPETGPNAAPHRMGLVIARHGVGKTALLVQFALDSLLRGNNVESESDREIFPDAVGYGESYLLDPFGEIVVRSQRHEECLIVARIDVRETIWEEKPFFASGRLESVRSARALRDAFLQTLDRIED